jgi:hypothetical protein
VPLVNSPTLTPAELAANRANGRQSHGQSHGPAHGPATQEGIERIRAADTRHRFYSKAAGPEMRVWRNRSSLHMSSATTVIPSLARNLILLLEFNRTKSRFLGPESVGPRNDVNRPTEFFNELLLHHWLRK